MNKKEHTILLNKISVLNGQKLSYVSRAGTMINLGFGELVKNKVAYKTEEGKFATKEVLTSRYALHLDCTFRVTCGNEILLSKCDIFNPNSTLMKAPDFIEEEFDWDIIGNNNFDEKAKKHFIDTDLNFVIKKVTISKFGDLKILLSNDFCLEAFIDSSENEECWRFFEVGNTDNAHLVITSNGFYEE